ncbi:MAG: hypothetical protein AAF597_06290, partial [Bacteroidota bacterium]
MSLSIRSMILLHCCLLALGLSGQPEDCDDFRDLYTPVQILRADCDSIILEAYPLGDPILSWYVGDSLLAETGPVLTYRAAADGLIFTLVVEADGRCDATHTEVFIAGGCPREDCANGIDDDGDGLIDLKDEEDCICRPPPPVLDFNLFPNPGFEVRRELPECSGCYAAGEAFPCVDGWTPGNSLTTIEHVLECFSNWINSPFRPYAAGTTNESIIGGFAAYDSLGFATMESALVPLLEPTIPGETYRLTFQADIGGGDILPLADDVTDEVLQNVAWYVSPQVDSFPYRFADYDSRVSGGFWDNWTILDSFFITVDRDFTFNDYVLEFVAPPQPIRMMAFTGTLNQPRRYFFTDRVGDYEFYWVLDNVQLQRITPPSILPVDIDNTVTATAIADTGGDACAQGVIFRVAFPESSDSYQWYREGVALMGQTNGSLALPPDSLNGSSYQVLIVRGESCNTSFPRRAVPEPPFQVTFSVDSINCGGTTTGWITALVSPSEAEVEYRWEDATGTVISQVAMADNLPAGVYQLSLTDVFGCVYAYDFVLDEPTPLSASVSAEQIRCDAADRNGTIDLSIAGGTEPYTILLNGEPVGRTNRYRLPVGDYVFSVIDAVGCTVTTPSISLSELAPFSLELVVANPLLRLGQSTTVSLTSNRDLSGATFRWLPAEWVDCSGCPSPTIRPNRGDTLRVAVVDVDGCARQATVPLTVVQPTNIFNLRSLRALGLTPQSHLMMSF